MSEKPTEITYKLVNGERCVYTNDKEFAKEFLFGTSSNVVTVFAPTPNQANPIPITQAPLQTAAQAPSPTKEGKTKDKEGKKRGGYRQPVDLEVTQTETAYVIGYPSGKKQVAKPLVQASADALRKLYSSNGGKPINCKELHAELQKHPEPMISSITLSTVVSGVVPIFRKIGAIDYWYGKHHELIFQPKGVRKPEEAPKVEA